MPGSDTSLFSLDQWFITAFNSFVKTQIAVPLSLLVSDSEDLVWDGESAFPASSPAMLLLLVREPHCESHCFTGFKFKATGKSVGRGRAMIGRS